MLYQWEIGALTAHEAIADLLAGARRRRGTRTPTPRVRQRAWSAAPLERVAEIDALIAGARAELAPRAHGVIDRLVLRLAIYELLAEPDTPAKVVINEALELARTFSGEEAVPFVNGVLDAVRKTLGRSDGAECTAMTERSSRQTDTDHERNPISCASGAPTSRSCSGSASRRIRTPFDADRHRRRRSSRRTATKTDDALEAEQRRRRRTAGRILAIRSFGKANFLVISDGARADPGLRPQGRAAASATSRSSSCSTSATSSASKGTCSAPRPTS